MRKFWKFLRYVFVTVVVIVLAMFFVMSFLLFDSATSCGDDSEAVAYARSMSKERLAKLYYDVEKFSLDPKTPYSDLSTDSEGVYPEPFSDINALRIRPKEENIMLNGCFDHYVVLSFEGFESNKAWAPKRQIVLSWGEHDSAGSEVLWSE